MDPFRINGRPVAPGSGPRLVSRTAILILSCVLIGTALGQGMLNGISICGFGAGVAGVIAFVALDARATRRRNQAMRNNLRQARECLAMRIERHVPRTDWNRIEHERRRHRTRDASWLTVTVE
jgi:hypothetical protein